MRFNLTWLKEAQGTASLCSLLTRTNSFRTNGARLNSTLGRRRVPSCRGRVGEFPRRSICHANLLSDRSWAAGLRLASRRWSHSGCNVHVPLFHSCRACPGTGDEIQRGGSRGGAGPHADPVGSAMG